MNFTDTHCHLAVTPLSADLPALVAQAAAVGVRRFIVPATCSADFEAVLALQKQPHIQVALGIHPWFSAEAQACDYRQWEQLLRSHPQLLVGEIGLDFHPNHLPKSSREQQIVCLQRQLQIAQQLQRPVILHNIKAAAALLQVLRSSGFNQGGVVHAFSGSLEEAHAFIDCGLLIGVGSLLLNPNARKLQRVVAALPAEQLVFETDSPFMVPRGETENTPANVRRIAIIAAQLRGVALADLAEQTEANVARLLAFQAASAL